MTLAEFLIGVGFKVDTKPLKDGEDQAKKSADAVSDKWKHTAKEVGDSFKAMGVALAAAGAAMFGLVNKATASAEAIGEGARAAGLSTHAYQRLEFAAKRSGLEMETVSKASRKLGAQLQEVANGGGEKLQQSLAAIGVSAAELQTLSPDQQLGLIADGLQSVQDPAKRVALSMALLGEEGGPKLATLLADGSRGLKDLGDEAERLGLVMNDDAIAKSAEFQDQLDNVKLSIGGLARDVGVALMPVIQEVVVEVQNWINANRGVLQQRLSEFVQTLAQAVREFLPAMVQLVGVATKVIDVLAKLAVTIGPEGTTAAVIGFKFATSQIGPAMLAQLGPIGAVTAAVAALTIGLIKYAEAQQEAELLATDNALHGGRTGKRGNAGRKWNTEIGRKVNDLTAEKNRLAEEGFGKNAMRIAEIHREIESLTKQDAEIGRVEGIRDEANARSNQFGQNFEARQARAAELRGEVRGLRGRRGDDLIGQYISGSITEDQLRMSASAGGGGGSGRRTPKGTTEETKSTAAASVSTDPLSQLLGVDALPNVPLNEITQEKSPQVLMATINNNFTVSNSFDIDGAGQPNIVADHVVEKFRDLMENDLQRTSKYTKVVFAR